MALLVATVDGPSEPQTVTLRGEVVRLAEAIEPLGIPNAQGPIAEQVVLKGDDGAMFPLLFNDGSHAFFQDDRLRDRPAELVARRFQGLPYLQVVSAKVADENGDLRTPEYYCDVCTISVRYDQPCPCCQGDLALRYRPE